MYISFIAIVVGRCRCASYYNDDDDGDNDDVISLDSQTQATNNCQ
jgi:hypothetical protein